MFSSYFALDFCRVMSIWVYIFLILTCGIRNLKILYGLENPHAVTASTLTKPAQPSRGRSDVTPYTKPFQTFPALRIHGSLLFLSHFTTSNSQLLAHCIISIYPTNFLRIHEKENKSLTSMLLYPPAPSTPPSPSPQSKDCCCPWPCPPQGPGVP